MQESETSKNSFSVPVAIVFAGALIAGAVFFSRGGSISNPQTGGTATLPPDQTSSGVIEIQPISASEHVLGNPAAPLSVVVYTDLECPFCKTFHATMQQIADIYGKEGKVLWVYRHFPLEQLHPKAPKEAEASECATELGGKQAFWDYVNGIFKITPSNNGLDSAQLPKIAKDIGLDETAFSACLASGRYAEKVQQEYAEAVKAGGRGTPFSVIVSNTPISDQVIASIQNLTITLPPETVVFSTDKRRVSVSGVFPLTLMQKILDIILQGGAS